MIETLVHVMENKASLFSFCWIYWEFWVNSDHKEGSHQVLLNCHAEGTTHDQKLLSNESLQVRYGLW